jgi:hypothetical protein
MVYHALNRANFCSALFKKEAHSQDFLALVAEGLCFVPMRLLAYCLMPNHWQMVLHSRADGEPPKFLQRKEPKGPNPRDSLLPAARHSVYVPIMKPSPTGQVDVELCASGS